MLWEWHTFLSQEKRRINVKEANSFRRPRMQQLRLLLQPQFLHNCGPTERGDNISSPEMQNPTCLAPASLVETYRNPMALGAHMRKASGLGGDGSIACKRLCTLWSYPRWTTRQEGFLCSRHRIWNSMRDTRKLCKTALTTLKYVSTGLLQFQWKKGMMFSMSIPGKQCVSRIA